MFELLITMLERLGIIVMIAFILTRFQFFRDMIYQERVNKQQQYKAILFFGFFGIIGTYSGLSLNADTQQFNRWASDLAFEEAIANSRVIGIVLAGLFGGYKVGIGAGLIAGIHRFTLGGFTAIACGFATIISGVLAGYFHKKGSPVRLSTAFLIGSSAEALQMFIIILTAKPMEKAVSLVEIIGVPMILANGLGSALFLLIIKNVVNEEKKEGALQTQKALRIADQTLVFLRNGINSSSASEVCKILHKEIKAKAVAITNTTEILAHVGMGNDHHKPTHPIQTQITKDVIKNGRLVVANDQTILCSVANCPLGAAVIAPLKQRDAIIGTLKVYFRSEKEITNLEVEMISGLSVLLSNQLEIAEAEKSYQLAKEAEIKVLQAQISPHFLFNTLNTVVSLIRVNPNKARKLLITLSKFLRQNLSSTTVNMTSLEQELIHTKAYLVIEETRFSDKLKVIYDIDKRALAYKIPPLTLQPIVENTVKHAFKDMEHNCIINVSICIKKGSAHISVSDNGSGMNEERINQIGNEQIDSEYGTGLALYNVNRRLVMNFGDESKLKITSSLKKGTEINFAIPLPKEENTRG
ncbi:sensor histidine kinase [Cytobacillus horneckiae]|uniref:sensor histidine kinase n=1 Tax=Cytobacillus horneckiae TaxID=549687 RepID=UPI00203C2519|nr:sensor histidine kinase [Cytobacillus horneckiae]MCM3176982.1 sensor histidine kinase [Cytobacillus horneckiae]